MKRAYGITVELYDRLHARQRGCCAICRCYPDERVGARHAQAVLGVDHDHATGAIRGLLCDRCNNGLGRFDDDPARLRAAAAYLDRHARVVKETRPADELPPATPAMV